MRYKNASDILPDDLLKEIQKYTDGEAIYIPKKSDRRKWGEGSGARQFYQDRNALIKKRYSEGVDMETLSDTFGLAFETVKKIIYSK